MFNPIIRKSDRKLDAILNKSGASLGFIEKIRKIPAKQDLWLIVDFDDTINKTTTSDKKMFLQLAQKAGAPEKSILEIYSASKLVNEFGKRVFRPQMLIDGIKKKFPNTRGLDNFLQKFLNSAFIDEGVKRALMSAKSVSPNRNIRISILTFGDISFQRDRINNSGILEVIDDAIYTEGSKKDVVEILASEYSKKDLPFIITVDDHPRHVDDFGNISLKKNYVNIRFNHPQAKRYGEPHNAKNAVVYNESSKNQAAINIFKATVIATDVSLKKNWKEMFNFFKNPDLYGKFTEENKLSENFIKKAN